MHLTPTEMDRLTIFTAAELARRRRAKGWKLTHPEALAIICDEMHGAGGAGRPNEGGWGSAGTVSTRAEASTAGPCFSVASKTGCRLAAGWRGFPSGRPAGPGG